MNDRLLVFLVMFSSKSSCCFCCVPKNVGALSDRYTITMDLIGDNSHFPSAGMLPRTNCCSRGSNRVTRDRSALQRGLQSACLVFAAIPVSSPNVASCRSVMAAILMTCYFSCCNAFANRHKRKGNGFSKNGPPARWTLLSLLSFVFGSSEDYHSN